MVERDDKGSVVEGGRVPGLLAAYKNAAENNLENLEQLLAEYFEDGSGKSLLPEKQSYVASSAKQMVFYWSAHRTIGRPLDKVEQKPFDTGRDDLRQELNIISDDELWKDLRQLQLTGNQKAGLKRRAWVLAEKAFPIDEEVD